MRLTAVDDPTEYHAAATADLTPPPGTTPAVPPEVVGIFPWTEIVATAAGDVTLAHIGIEVSGRWRGGDVVVSVSGGEQRVTKGRIGEIERTFDWIVPSTATLTIRVVPFGNPAGAAEVTHDVDGPDAVHTPIYVGEWVEGTQYSIADIVTDRERSFIALTNHTATASNRPPEANRSSTDWALNAGRGTDGINGINGDDGQGYEYTYARSARGFVIRDTDYPDDAWEFDTFPSQGRITLGKNGAANGRLKWHDGLPGRSDALPIGWYSWRRYRKQPKLKGHWSDPVSFVEDGQNGIQGVQGDDGNGLEHTFARSARGFVIRATDYPDNAWGFDSFPSQGRLKGRLRWHDGLPVRTSALPVAWYSWRRYRVNPRSKTNWSPPVEFVEDGVDGVTPTPSISNISGQRGCIDFGDLRICTDSVTNRVSGTTTLTFAGRFRSAPFVQILVADRATVVTSSISTEGFQVRWDSGGDAPDALLKYTAWGLKLT